MTSTTPRTSTPRAWCAAAVAALFTLASACGGSRAAPEPPMQARLQEAVDEFLAGRRVPGASVAIIDQDREVAVVSGVAELDNRPPVSVDTQFRVASVTKMYIATIALRLVERGELRLNRAIDVGGTALPEHLGVARRVTLRQLLSHTTGFPQTITRDEDRHSRLTLRDRLDRIPPPVCEPGACWSYADGNYVLAQLVLETATGKSLGELFREELIEPFGLSHTELVDGTTDDALPAQYALVSDDSGRPTEPKRLFEQALPRYETLVTTARDAARLADQLFGGDVLEAPRLEQMLDTAAMRDLPCPEGCRFEYGLGVFHYELAGRELVGHDGSSGAIVVHDPDRDLTVAILTNGGEQDVGALLETVLEAVEEPAG